MDKELSTNSPMSDPSITRADYVRNFSSTKVPSSFVDKLSMDFLALATKQSVEDLYFSGVPKSSQEGGNPGSRAPPKPTPNPTHSAPLKPPPPPPYRSSYWNSSSQTPWSPYRGQTLIPIFKPPRYLAMQFCPLPIWRIWGITVRTVDPQLLSNPPCPFWTLSWKPSPPPFFSNFEKTI